MILVGLDVCFFTELRRSGKYAHRNRATVGTRRTRVSWVAQRISGCVSKDIFHHCSYDIKKVKFFFSTFYNLSYSFETALRRVDPSVSLPYWDSSKDFVMADPTQTSFFSSALMGNGDGIVVNGPFANWPARPDGQRLNRDIGVIGSLFTPEGLNMFLNDPTVNLTRQIVVGTGEALANTLEGQHNNVHNWVGGDMSRLNTAAHDPVFFMYHAHVDYVWERFREKQNALGSANPETDYPIINTPLHHPDRALDGFENVTNIEAFSNRYTRELYTYANSPECADGCGGSRFLRCDETINRCVSLTATEIGGTADTNQNPTVNMGDFQFFNTFTDPRARFARSVDHVRRKRDNSHIQTLLAYTPNFSKTIVTHTNPLLGHSFGKPVTHINKMGYSMKVNPIRGTTPVMERGRQNLFSLNGVADVSRWAYIPVKVVHERDLSGTGFNSPLILRDQFVPGVDIYNPMVYTALRPLFQLNGAKLAKFPTCKTVNSGVKKVYIRSDGLTYDGYFVEHAVVDERQPISETTVYVAVKHPKLGPGKAMLTAYDSAGSVCEPKCLIPGSFPPAYRSCSGIINISNLPPKMYSDDYGQAVRSQWNFAPGNCPSQQSSPIFLVFYCSPSVQWPWKKCL